MMSGEIEIKSTNVVRRSPAYRITTPNVAVAEGFTPDGRAIQGIGAALLSEDTALDAAVGNLKQNAQDVDFSFEIAVIEGGNVGGRIEIYDDGIRKRPSSSWGRPTVEINATRDGSGVNAKGKPGVLETAGFSPSFGAALVSAIDSAESQFDRVGRTSV
jgi:hypothetical protein